MNWQDTLRFGHLLSALIKPTPVHLYMYSACICVHSMYSQKLLLHLRYSDPIPEVLLGGIWQSAHLFVLNLIDCFNLLCSSSYWGAGYSQNFSWHKYTYLAYHTDRLRPRDERLRDLQRNLYQTQPIACIQHCQLNSHVVFDLWCFAWWRSRYFSNNSLLHWTMAFCCLHWVKTVVPSVRLSCSEVHFFWWIMISFGIMRCMHYCLLLYSWWVLSPYN